MDVSPSGTPVSAYSWPPGDRVVVRRRLLDASGAAVTGPGGGPATSDSIGTVEARDGSGWTVRRADGGLVVIPAEVVVAARRIPAAVRLPATAIGWGTADLERVADLGWPGLEREHIGDWVLRASGGFTGRANSALPLGDPGRAEEAALSQVRDWYASRGLPALLQLPLPLAQPLLDRVAAAGWRPSHAGEVLVRDLPLDLPPADLGPEDEVAFSASATRDWLELYRYRGATIPPRAVEVLAAGSSPVFVTLLREGSPVAIGRLSVAEGWAGVTAVEVAAEHRRRGLAGQVMAALLRRAYASGARHAYLQVDPGNDAGRALYARLGFRRHHGYVYLASG